MRRIIRFIDWRLVLSITVLLIVAAAIQSSLATAHDRDRLAAQSVHDRQVAAVERQEASEERARLLTGQRQLEIKYDALLATQNRIVAYLNGRGIFVPRSVLDVHADDSDDDGSGGSHSSSTDGSGKQLPPKSGPPIAGAVGKPSAGFGKGHEAGAGRSKGHRSTSSSGGSHEEAKGNAQPKGHGKAKGHQGSKRR